MLASLLDIVFPRRCAACRVLLPPENESAPLGAMCALCSVTLDPVAGSCPRCGLPGEGGGSCRACETHDYAFDRCLSRLHYGAAIADMLHRYKYEDHPEFAAPLADFIVELPLPEVDVVAPVPLHPTRRRQRTYDQALYLAQWVARRRKLPCDAALLTRVRPTGRQVGKSRDARVENVRGAFRASGRARGKAVLLIDDVVTTGATASECARALKAAGARQVFVASVARAV